MRSLALGLLTILSAFARADDTYTIKVKVDVDPGRTVTYRDIMKGDGSIKGYDLTGKLLFERKRERMETVYRTTVLEADKDGKATKYLRVYDTVTETDDGKKKTLSYQGRTVLFEKVDGKFRLGLAGEPALDSSDAERLYNGVNKKSESIELLRNLPPSKPVKVGESWAVAVKPVAEAIEDSVVDQSKSSVTAKLVKVYSKGRSQFGTFDVTARFLVTAMTEAGIVMAFDPPATYDLRWTLDLAIDGSSPERTKKEEAALKGEGRVTLGTDKRRIVFDVRGTGESELSAQVYDAKARTIPKVTILPTPGEWTEFKPKDGIWVAKFPGHPLTTTNKAGGHTETRWVVEVDSGTMAYGVVVTEFADPTKIDPPAIQKVAMDTAKGVRGVKDIEVAGLKGVEFTCDEGVEGLRLEVTRRMIITKQRAFELTAVALKGKKAQAEKFFSSFQILKKPPAKDD